MYEERSLCLQGVGRFAYVSIHLWMDQGNITGTGRGVEMYITYIRFKAALYLQRPYRFGCVNKRLP